MFFDFNNMTHLIRTLSMALQSVTVLTRFDCIVAIELNATVKFFLVETCLSCAIPFVLTKLVEVVIDYCLFSEGDRLPYL